MSEVQQRPFSIRIFVPDGDPDGLRLVERSNWATNGCIEWKTDNGITLKELQSSATGDEEGEDV